MHITQDQNWQKVRTLTVDEANAGQRLDNFLRAQLKGVPKTMVYRIVRKGEVRVNKGRAKPEYKLQPGDQVRIPPLRMADKEAAAPIQTGLLKQVEQAILYEDTRLMVVNKPSGLAVHGGSGLKFGLIEVLRQLRPQVKSLELVHRLDRDTSGCVMVAKKRSMLRFLHQALREDRISKHYLALVPGRWPNRRKQVDAALQKNTLQSGERMVVVSPEGKAARTQYQVVQAFPGYTLVEAKPVTGRTHQIRVHCRHAGFPILGDDKYGDENANKEAKLLGLKRLFLHAVKLSIPLPDSRDTLDIQAPLDEELEFFLARIKA